MRYKGNKDSSNMNNNECQRLSLWLGKSFSYLKAFTSISISSRNSCFSKDAIKNIQKQVRKIKKLLKNSPHFEFNAL